MSAPPPGPPLVLPVAPGPGPSPAPGRRRRRLAWLAGGTAAALATAGVVVAVVRSGGDPAASPDACGDVVRKPDGTAWRCTFVDQFDGDALDRTAWVPQTDFPSGDGAATACAVDDPDNLAVADGVLSLTVRQAEEPTLCQGSPVAYTGASISTYHLFSQQYGRFEARVKVAATDQPGLHEAFWLWPDDRVPSQEVWPAAGEIDVSETYSLHPDLSVPFLHYTANDNGGPIDGTNTSYSCAASRGEWHDYLLTWTDTELRIAVDGQECLVNTSDDPAFDKPYILALSAALGVAENADVGGAPIPATTEVDWVKVWK